MKLTTDPTQQQQCVDKTIAWLHHVWEMTEEGRHIQADPFYARNKLLTPAVVKQVMASIEDIFKSELQRYPGYHRTAQGISAREYLIPPGFDHLPHDEQLAVVQGIDRIFQEYRADPGPDTPGTTAAPPKPDRYEG